MMYKHLTGKIAVFTDIKDSIKYYRVNDANGFILIPAWVIENGNDWMLQASAATIEERVDAIEEWIRKYDKIRQQTLL